MLFRAIFFLLFLSLNWSPGLRAQREFITITKANGTVELPFEYENNFIIIKTVLNSILPVRFIFDTGAENTVLINRELADLIAVNYQRQVTIYGADLRTELKAYVGTGIHFEFNEQLRIANQTILVLEEDYFQFGTFAGINVHGIIGADLLRRFVVKIDYQRRKITLQDPSRFRPPRPTDYHKIPVDFSRHKPYITLSGDVFDYQGQQLKLLMDTGANLSLLLYTNRQDSLAALPDNLIPTHIGMGLGGQLNGFVGRTARVELGDYTLQNVLTNFQDVTSLLTIDSSLLNDRHGIIGNKILDRFTLIIDYIREEVYARSNRHFTDEFVYDRSGLSLAANTAGGLHYIVIYVTPNSPAAEAGIQVGDEIRRINGLPTYILSLEDIIMRLQRKPGKRIKVVLDRNGTKIKRSFSLRDLI
ncbi:MAG: PDZ domain-containing protein [Bacteroidetes bacterium]|nr:MAG: PDZ domain-containing protein [Bacteroidota bacterium]